MLARVFQALAERKPDLDAGVYAYARAGFGDYPGFLSAFGYWIGTCIGNVSYWVLIKSTLGAFFPVFGDGNTVTAIAVASVGIWLFHAVILRGVQQAAFINTIVTIAKIIPIVVFIAILIGAFNTDLFAVNFWGGKNMPETSLLTQIAPRCCPRSSSFSASKARASIRAIPKKDPTSARRRFSASSA